MILSLLLRILTPLGQLIAAVRGLRLLVRLRQRRRGRVVAPATALRSVLGERIVLLLGRGRGGQLRGGREIGRASCRERVSSPV